MLMDFGAVENFLGLNCQIIKETKSKTMRP
jgi:hypothetical protein